MSNSTKANDWVRFVVAAAILALAYWAYPNGVLDKPFTNLTLRDLGGLVLSLGLVWWAFLVAIES